MQQKGFITDELLQEQASYVAELLSQQSRESESACLEVVIPLAHFAERIGAPQTTVEQILFNAILQGYIRGTIDSLSQTITCTYGRASDCSKQAAQETIDALLLQKEHVLARLLSAEAE